MKRKRDDDEGDEGLGDADRLLLKASYDGNVLGLVLLMSYHHSFRLVQTSTPKMRLA